MPNGSPQEQLNQMITGYWTSQCIYVAAKLELADLLAKGPQTAAQLASATGADPEALYRLLRALASAGIFAEDEQHLFTLTPLAERLRSDVPGSQRAMAIMMGEEHYHVWGDLIYSVETGQPAFERIYGMPVFEFLAQNPEKGKIFDQAMVGVHGRETGDVLDAYDFSRFSTIADIGGGNGSLLTGILERYSTINGILFDLPDVVERANEAIGSAGLSERIHLVAGDFFVSVPSGADAYMLRHIIHDWDAERAIRILRTVHSAMPQTGKLLILESVIPAGNERFFGKLLDLTMLLIPGGKERTEEEYRHLLGSAGFRLVHVVPTRGELSVIEAEKV